MSLETSNSCGKLVDSVTVNDLTSKITVNEIVDNDFMVKDVSELVEGDFYLFHTVGDVMYFYKDGVVLYSSVVDTSEVTKVKYTKGSLQEFVDSCIKG